LEELPDFTDYSMEGRTYRYLKKEPLYPFGYGLTYGDTVVTALQFAGSDDPSSEQLSHMQQPEQLLKMRQERLLQIQQQGITVRVSMKNRGSVPTGEVLQIYVQLTGNLFETLHPRLAAFKRVWLEAGQELSVEVHIPAQAFSAIDEQGQRCLTAASARIYAGVGQPDDRTAALLGQRGKMVEVTA
jgi:beta-glucosidase